MTNTPTTGSPLVGNTRAAAAAATTARKQQTKSWQSSIVTRFTVGIAGVIIAWIVQANVEWNLFWQIVAGFGLMFLAGQVQKFPEDFRWHWAGLLRVIGVSIIVISVMSSGFAKLAERTVVYLDCVAAGSANCRSSNNTLTGKVTNTTLPPVVCSDYHSYCIGRMPDLQLAAGEESAWVKNYTGSCLTYVGMADNEGEVLYRATETGPWTTTKPPSFWFVKFEPQTARTIHVIRRAGQTTCD